MAITTLDGYIASAKQSVEYTKVASRTAVAAAWYVVRDQAGSPGAWALAGTNTANGVVPTDATTGAPLITPFGGGATGYLGAIDFGSTVTCRMILADILFLAGAYSFNSNVTLASQPSYSARVPGGTDFSGTQIWIEAVTAFTGNLSVAVTYTNQSGTAGRTTGTFATGLALPVGRMMQLPLQAGDSGVQKIESVIGTVATVGTFNVLVARPLWQGRVHIANGGDTHGIDKTGMPVVFDTSAFGLFVAPDSTATGLPSLFFDVVNG